VERSTLSLPLNGKYAPAGRDVEGLRTQSLAGLVDSNKRFRNGRKIFLKRLGVSNGFPVSLFVSGS
jgi:hypothetical protein